MSFETFRKENLDELLKELAKEYRKLSGKSIPAEIILIGGAAIIENYDFREMTADVDALISASSAMKDAIAHIADKFNLPSGWLNDDFKKTASFSPYVREVSHYYKTFYGILTVRTLSAEHLIAMKLKSGRMYKNDLSDVVGILLFHKNHDMALSKELILQAVEKLYGSITQLPENSKRLLDNLFSCEKLEKLYSEVRLNEINARTTLIEFNDKYPDVLKIENVHSVLEILRKKTLGTDS